MREEVREKGRRVERSKREREESGQRHFLRVEACSLQFSQVSDRLFTLVRDLPGNPRG